MSCVINVLEFSFLSNLQNTILAVIILGGLLHSQSHPLSNRQNKLLMANPTAGSDISPLVAKKPKYYLAGPWSKFAHQSESECHEPLL